MDFSLLLPNIEAFRLALASGKWAPDAFSAAIVIILLILFGIFLVWVIIGGVLSLRRIKFFKELLRDVTADELVSKRRELNENAKKNKKLGQLWVEFDETLVMAPDNSQLWNTVDADYFFNSHALASGITESRLIAAVPGLLTAIGVIGTFAGLQLGLSSLNLTASELAETTSQVENLIGSAAIAFLTSLWGIGTSVFFNVFEKSVEQNLRRKIFSLQETIDALFCKIRPEQKLIEIEHHQRESSKTLAGLAEKIGDRMQEAVSALSTDISAGIVEAMNKSVAPSIERLMQATEQMASRQSESNSNALESLVARFVGTVGEHADQQRQLMQHATSEIRGATEKMNSGIDGLLQSMDSQVVAMKAGQLHLLDSVKTTVQDNVHESSKLLSLGKELAEKVSAMSQDLTNIGSELQESTSSLQSTSGHLSEVGKRMEAVSNQFSDVMQHAVSTTTQYISETKDLTSTINSSLDFLGGFERRTSDLTTNITEIAGTVENGLSSMRTRQQEFLDGMQKNLQATQDQVATLLREYGESVSGQTERRLNEWNNQTRDFSEQMISAVQNIHQVVSEIEDLNSSAARRLS